MEPNEIDLSPFAALVQAERSADESRRYHEAEAKQYERVRDQIREQLAKVMGDRDQGLINGKEVFKKTVSSQFAWARFIKENPDIAPEYTVARLVDEIDKDRLRKELPDLYARYCTVRYTNTSDVL